MKIHHIGIVSDDIETAAERYGELFGLHKKTSIVTDPIQNSRLLLLSAGTDGTVLELVEPLDATSPVANFLKNGGGRLHHICYEVDCIEETIDCLRKKHCLLISGPSPAILFEGRKVAFMYTTNKELVEFLQSESKT